LSDAEYTEMNCFAPAMGRFACAARQVAFSAHPN
jgi:hypothetical protein